MTFPRAVGQIPIHHDAETTGRPARAGGSMAVDRWDVGLQGPNNLDDYYTSKFLDLERGPRFAFGHGLSYTTFRVEAASVSASQISVAELRAGARVTASVTVRNIGDRDGDDVVFAHLADPVASIAQPVQRLRGFRRVTVAAGATADVSFDFGANELGFWDDENRFEIEPGELVITLTDGTDAEPLALTITE
jgi:beta-glucosidase